MKNYTEAMKLINAAVEKQIPNEWRINIIDKNM